MHSENGVLVDFDEISSIVANADVFAVGFSNFPERLLIDTRSNDQEQPMIQIVEPARSAQHRLAWLQRRRPSFDAPRSFSFFAWPHSPAFLEASGIWDRLVRAAGGESDPGVALQCELALRQLYNLDRAATFAVLKGENCVTLWPPEPDDE